MRFNLNQEKSDSNELWIQNLQHTILYNSALTITLRTAFAKLQESVILMQTAKNMTKSW